MPEANYEAMAAIAAFFSAIATVFAAIATFRGPRSAAELAESLRQAHNIREDARRNKLIVFANLMENRASITSERAVGSLNLIDVVFNDCRAVREAWAELFLSFDGKNNIPPHEQDARLRRMLLAMAEDLGMSDNLRTDDIGRIYFPAVLAEENELAHLERRRALERLRNPEHVTTNAATEQKSLWPPKPELSDTQEK